MKADLNLQPCTIDDLLRSFPDFYYRDIYSATFSGNFGFRSTFKIDVDPPFRNDLQVGIDQNIRLEQPGNLDLGYLKSPFRHTVYDQGQKIAELFLGESDRNYAPLTKISRYMKSAIVLAEDRDFYEHKGINIQLIRYTIVKNIEARRVIRGASTITMQLMKNLFLTQDRNIRRKIEETFLTWLTEDVFKIDKERILEIYLNIIEFAPGIYGIVQASDHYFSKRPDELSLTESLVLTYIVPRPKFFPEAVKMRSEILIKKLRRHIEAISNLMLERGVITKEEFEGICYDIEFSKGLGELHLRGNEVR